MISKAADVYALGVIMWHAWTGWAPWAGLRHVQILEEVLEQQRALVFPPGTPDAIRVRGGEGVQGAVRWQQGASLGGGARQCGWQAAGRQLGRQLGGSWAVLAAGHAVLGLLFGQPNGLKPPGLHAAQSACTLLWQRKVRTPTERAPHHPACRIWVSTACTLIRGSAPLCRTWLRGCASCFVTRRSSALRSPLCTS